MNWFDSIHDSSDFWISWFVRLLNQAKTHLILIRFMIHMIQFSSLLVWIYLYTYIWSGFGLIAVCTKVTRHNILVCLIDLTQHLFGIDSIQLMIQSGLKKWIDSSSDSSGYEKCDSIRFMIQAKIIWFWFHSCFKSESFTSLLLSRFMCSRFSSWRAPTSRPLTGSPRSPLSGCLYRDVI